MTGLSFLEEIMVVLSFLTDPEFQGVLLLVIALSLIALAVHAWTGRHHA